MDPCFTSHILETCVEIRSIGGEVRSLSCRRRVVACREFDRCIVWEMLMSMVPCNIFINALVPFLWNMLLETDGAVPRFLVSSVFCGRSTARVLYKNVESIRELYIPLIHACIYIFSLTFVWHQNIYMSYIDIYVVSCRQMSNIYTR